MKKTPCKCCTARVGFFLGLCLFAITLTLYIMTLCPTVSLVDSGELILVCKTLGIAHSPGFPLYTLLGHLFTYIPIGSIAYRVNLMSAVFAALSAVVRGSSCRRMCR